ncbi:unnamed protein product [Ectocarpus sp. 13 AM-2016]
MQKEGIPRSLAPELRVMSDLGWRFQDKIEADALVNWLAPNMQNYSMNTAIRSEPCNSCWRVLATVGGTGRNLE